MSLLNWGLVSGALFGSGLLLVWRGLPRNRRTVLMDRVGPYLRDEVAIPSTLLSGAVTARGWVPVLTPVLGPTLTRAARLVDQVIGDGATVRRRLLRAGRAPDVELFRVQQVLAGVAGAGAALVMSMIGLATGQLGAIVAVVMVLIAILVVGWFGSYTTPIAIMSPIPLSLIGIIPAHAIAGAFFTATSMIGVIAGAGIVVRNSIILVDFIAMRRAEGDSLEEAVVEAGAVRFRPMVLTALSVVAGAFVILFDPIFQGLAISLLAGEVAATLFSRMVVPVMYYLDQRGR